MGEADIPPDRTVLGTTAPPRRTPLRCAVIARTKPPAFAFRRRRCASQQQPSAWHGALALRRTFACLLGDWHFHRPLPHWAVAQAAGGQLIGAGLIPLAQSFIEFTRADGTPVPVASPRLVVNGFHRHVRNPIHAAPWPP